MSWYSIEEDLEVPRQFDVPSRVIQLSASEALAEGRRPIMTAYSVLCKRSSLSVVPSAGWVGEWGTKKLRVVSGRDVGSAGRYVEVTCEGELG